MGIQQEKSAGRDGLRPETCASDSPCTVESFTDRTWQRGAVFIQVGSEQALDSSPIFVAPSKNSAGATNAAWRQGTGDLEESLLLWLLWGQWN